MIHELFLLLTGMNVDKPYSAGEHFLVSISDVLFFLSH